MLAYEKKKASGVEGEGEEEEYYDDDDDYDDYEGDLLGLSGSLG